jgi:hypothetical protein
MLIHLIGCVEVIFQIVLVNPLLPPTNVFFPLIRKEKKKKNAQKVQTFYQILSNFLVALFNYLSYLGAWRKVLTALYIIIHEQI